MKPMRLQYVCFTTLNSLKGQRTLYCIIFGWPWPGLDFQMLADISETINFKFTFQQTSVILGPKAPGVNLKISQTSPKGWESMKPRMFPQFYRSKLQVALKTNTLQIRVLPNARSDEIQSFFKMRASQNLKKLWTPVPFPYSRAWLTMWVVHVHGRTGPQPWIF